MDLLSITTATVSLTFTFAKITKCFLVIRDTHKSASITVTAMIAECNMISTSLSQIPSLVLKNPVALSSRLALQSNLVASFEDSLIACQLTLSVIEGELEYVVGGEQGVGSLGFKARAKFVWKEYTMITLLGQLRGQQAAIGVLVSILQT
ncbi:MAG: hypothetical protein M1839_006753 [Geoglossum umbratile]|nr:MAG: hypothetical protein M1839_006753 [Geoglossum umbratile]